jgi:hypothetical protein
VASAPHAVAAFCLDNYSHALFVIAFLDSVNQFMAHFRTQAVEMLLIAHFYKTDAIFDRSFNQHNLEVFPKIMKKRRPNYF